MALFAVVAGCAGGSSLPSGPPGSAAVGTAATARVSATQPQVTRERPDGGYLIEGMKFSMTGWWEIKLAIDGPAGADRVTFNTVVAEAGASR